MANNNRCGCSRRRNSNNNGYGCLNSVGGRWRWDNYLYYTGPCPDVEGNYDDDDDNDNDHDDRDCRRRRRRCRRGVFGLFTALTPIAVAANGIIPLVKNNHLSCKNNFNVNSGLITIKEEGTYLAIYTVRIPEDVKMDTTITLNANDAPQSAATSIIDTGCGSDHTFSITAQTIFEADEGDTVTLRTSESINICESSVQPLFTLTLIKLD